MTFSTTPQLQAFPGKLLSLVTLRWMFVAILSIGLSGISFGQQITNDAPTSVDVNEIFTVAFSVESPVSDVDGVTIEMEFDPMFLEVISLNTDPDDLFTNVLLENINPTSFKASMGALGTNVTYPTGTFKVLEVEFRALAATPNTDVGYICNGNAGTAVTFQANPVVTCGAQTPDIMLEITNPNGLGACQQTLFRVNAGAAAVDDPNCGGVDWSSDTAGSPSPFVTLGTCGNCNKVFSTNDAIDMTHPSLAGTGATQALFQSERWDHPENPEMNWDFTVPANAEVEVRLYFAEIFATANDVRVFDVAVEGVVPPVYDDLDIHALVGHDKGIVLAHTVTVGADGNLDIDFQRIAGKDNPKVSAIEICLVSAPGNQPPVVEICSPEDGVTIQRGTDVAFLGVANDFEDGDISSSLNWSANNDLSFSGTGESFTTELREPGLQTITASATDSDGSSGDDQINVTVSPPQVMITSPLDGATIVGTNVTLTWDAIDVLYDITEHFHIFVNDPGFTNRISTVGEIGQTFWELDENSGEGLVIGTNTISIIVARPDHSEFLGIPEAFDEITFTIEAPPVGEPAALVEVTPGGGLAASTFSASSFQITNNSTEGVQITSVSIDLSTGILPDMVFDPTGSGGDATASPFTPNAGAAATGLVVPGDPAVDPFSAPREGGFDIITVNFTEFDPGEQFFFTTDVDPNSIQGVPGAGAAGAAAGLELAGATVTIMFDDGSTLVSSLYEDGSLGGAQAVMAASIPAAPTITVVGYPSTPTTVPDLNQTILVTGTPGDYVSLLQLDARLFIASGDPPYNVADPTYYANDHLAKVVYNAGPIPASGVLDIPVTLLETMVTPPGGLNHFMAVTSAAPYAVDQLHSQSSNVIVLKYDPEPGNLVFDPMELTLVAPMDGTQSSDDIFIDSEDASTLPSAAAISVTYGPGATGWLTVPAFMTQGTGAPFTADATGLSPGIYTATVTGGSVTNYIDATMTVTLVVFDSQEQNICINTGDPSASHTATNGLLYQVDNSFTGGTTFQKVGLPIAYTLDDQLYRSERYGNFSYSITVPNGEYVVLLNFAEIYFGSAQTPNGPGNAGARIFNVDIEGVEVLTALDIFDEIGADAALDRSFEVTVTDGTIDIAFATVVDNAKISGICVLPKDAPSPCDVAISSVTPGDPTSCGAADGTITVVAMGSNGTLEYSIDGGASWEPDGNFTGLLEGAYNVVVRYDDETCEVVYDTNPVVLTDTSSPEICNGIDDDCDGLIDADDPDLVGGTTYYADGDLDGFGAANDLGTVFCDDPGAGWSLTNDDCNDGEETINPAAQEVCDGIDNDCDGLIDDNDPSVTGQSTWYADTDSDGFGDPNNSVQSCNQPSGFVADNTDCDDVNANVNPNAQEVCDGIDNDCDGLIDDNDPSVTGQSTWYADTDSDGFGDPNNSVQSCNQPSGFVADNTDCDDVNANVNPNAQEVCDGIDNDCDGLIDDNDPSVTGQSTWYADTDSDGFGDPNNSVQSCNQPSGFVADNTDCDDTDANTYPGAPELCDGLDNDCDGVVPPNEGGQVLFRVNNNGPTLAATDASAPDWATDGSAPIADYLVAGGTGQSSTTNAIDLTHPSLNNTTAPENLFKTERWDNPNAPEMKWEFPIATAGNIEVRLYFAEIYGPTSDPGERVFDVEVEGSVPAVYDNIDVYILAGNQANRGIMLSHTVVVTDGSLTIEFLHDTENPAIKGIEIIAIGSDDAQEICNGIDDDCDGLIDDDDPDLVGGTIWYADTDGDTYGDPNNTVEACDQPAGYVADNTDCDDTNAAVNPAAQEICDGIDNDCDGLIDDNDPSVSGQGTWYADTDGDTYGDPNNTVEACDQPAGYVADNTDCDDTNAAVNLAAQEICDGIDNDCDGLVDSDDPSVTGTTTWYADTDGDTYGDPNNTVEACDQPAGYVADNTDCDDTNDQINPTAQEICDGIDNNCDGLVDDDDPSVAGQSIWYADTDGDGFGDPNNSTLACNQPAGFVADNTDCDDTNDQINPAAPEICDDIDNNCDGLVDDEDPNLSCNQPPVADCADIVRSADENCEATASAMEFDGGSSDPDGDPLIFSVTPSGPYSIGETEVTLTVEDSEGATSTCKATITVEDTTKPTFTSCPGNFDVSADSDLCTASLEVPVPGVTDNCGVTDLRFRYRINEGGGNTGPWSAWTDDVSIELEIGRWQIQWRARDAALNARRCNYFIEVEDTMAPEITCPGAIVVDNDPGDCGAVVSYNVPVGSDNCPGAATVQTDGLGSGSFFPVGSTTETYQVTDAGGLMASCSFTVTVNDTEPSGLTCPASIDVGNDLGDCGATVTYTIPTATDNCATGSLEAVLLEGLGSGASFPAGETVTEVYGYTDGDGVQYTCNIEITVTDTEAPELNCSGLNITVENDPGECEAVVDFPVPGVEDNCDVKIFEFRYREVDENNNALGPWTEWFSHDEAEGQVLEVGRYRVRWRAGDAESNTSGCTRFITVIDTEVPMVNCSPTTIIFNGEETLSITANEVASATDNCGLLDLSLDQNTFSCEDVGQTVLVSVMAEDIYGLTSSCMAEVTVAGLPCGWSQDSDGVGCEDGNEVDYDAAGDTFTVMSTDCHNPISTNTDEYAFAQYNLCGNGQITAQVTGISGSSFGWAGVTMRESDDPQSKHVTFSTNFSANHRKEVRTITGGGVTSQLMPSFNRHWLRIRRVGNQFLGYSSFNGLSWFLRFAQTVPMDECLEVGLVLNGYFGSGELTATFANVTVEGTSFFGFQADDGPVVEETFRAKSLSVFPNPTSGQVTVTLGDFLEEEGRLEVLDVNGQMVKLAREGILEYSNEQLDLTDLPAGVYFIRLRLDDGNMHTQRLILQPRP